MATEPSRQTLDTNGRRLDGDRPGQDINMFATARTMDDFSTPPNFFGLPVTANVVTSTRDFGGVDDDQDDDDAGSGGGTRSPHGFPFTARNAFFAERRASFDTSSDLAEAAARQADAQQTANTYFKAIQEALPGAFAELNAKLDAINTTIGAFDRQERDDVVAIYAVAFGPHGGVSEHSDAGVWIRRAWPLGAKIDKPTISNLADLGTKDAARFAKALAETRDQHDLLVAKLSDADLRRFLALLPEVCRAIGAKSVATPPPEPPSVA